MARSVIAPDRVLLLLSLVPYLREHGPTPVPELAETFGVSPSLLRRLVRFLGTAGVPGETMTYQAEDLFDIDWDALEEDDVVSLTRIVAVDDTPRFAPAETAALVAGLHALTAVLPEADAELAQRIAARLAAALGEGERGPALSVTAEAGPGMPAIVSAIDSGRALAFRYRDASGAETSRTVDPLALVQEAGAWYLRAHCRDRGAERSFRVEQMREVREAGPAAPSPSSPPSAQAPRETAAIDIVATVPARVLPRLRGFEPEVLAETEDRRIRIRVEGWHRGAAIRLVQEAPGEVVVESPVSARDAVRDWAARALAAYDG